MDRVELNGGGLLSSDNLEKVLFELLLEKTRKLGRVLSFKDVKNDSKMPNPNIYATRSRFSSFSEAAKAAFSKVQFEKEFPNGLPKRDLGDESNEPRRYSIYDNPYEHRFDGLTSEEVVEKKRAEGRKRVEILKRLREREAMMKTRRETRRKSKIKSESEVEKMEKKNDVKQAAKVGREKAPRVNWTKEAVIAAIKRFYDEYGKLPTASCFRGGCDYLPAEMTVRKHLGKKEYWLAAIGVEKASDMDNGVDESEGESVLTHEEINNMLEALESAGLDEADEPSGENGEPSGEDDDRIGELLGEIDDAADAFSASGELESARDETSCAEILSAEASRAEVSPVVVVNRALADFVAKIQAVETEGVKISISVQPVNSQNAITVQMEF